MRDYVGKGTVQLIRQLQQQVFPAVRHAMGSARGGHVNSELV